MDVDAVEPFEEVATRGATGSRREHAKQLTALDQTGSPPSLTWAAESAADGNAQSAAHRFVAARNERGMRGLVDQRAALSGTVGCESSRSSGILTSSENGGVPEPAFWRPLTARRKLR